MAKVKKYGMGGMLGVLPELLDKGGKNAGFALGVLPGLLYKDKYEDDAAEERAKQAAAGTPMKKGGKVSSASKRADGCAQRGKTRGRLM